MEFRGKEMMKKLLKKVGEKNLANRAKEQLQQSIPDNKVVMNLAKISLYTDRHIQFGNRICEDDGNKSRRSWKHNVLEKHLFSYILDRQI